MVKGKGMLNELASLVRVLLECKSMSTTASVLLPDVFLEKYLARSNVQLVFVERFMFLSFCHVLFEYLCIIVS